MVKGGAAILGVKDATSVVLEDGSVSFHSHRDWTGGNGCHQLLSRPFADSRVTFDGDVTNGLTSFALAILSVVWISSLGADASIALDPVEGIALPSTTATGAFGIAVYELLFGE